MPEVTFRAFVDWTMLVRLRLPKWVPPVPIASAMRAVGPITRSPLANGTYPELEVRARRIGCKGKVDLLVLGNDACEVTDFKTGAADEAHAFQVRVYAALDLDLRPLVARERADRFFVDQLPEAVEKA